jgi:ferredoxin
MPRLTVLSALRETLAVLDAPSDKPLYFVLCDGGVPVASACGGKAQCGLCRITIVEGWENLSAPVPVEETHLGNLMHIGHLRLSCQTRLVGDATIEIPVCESKEDRLRRKANARKLTQERAAARGGPGGSPRGRGR